MKTNRMARDIARALVFSSVFVVSLLSVACSDNDCSSTNCNDNCNSNCNCNTEEPPLVLAAFQAWHGLPSHAPAWEGSPFPASSLPYDSRDATVITRQILEAKELGIQGFVVDWYGPAAGVANDDDREYIDQATAELVTQAEEHGFLVALMYDEGTVSSSESATVIYTALVQSDLDYAERYYASPAYLEIDEQPALFIFPYANVDPFVDWPAVRNQQVVQVTLIGETPDPENWTNHDQYFDGFYSWVQGWDPFGLEWGRGYLEWFYETMSSGNYADLITVGGVWPGFDDLLAPPPWGQDRYISRRSGQTYDDTWELARAHHVPIIMIDTWNDFEEGTDIEFGVTMTVNMEEQEPKLLFRSSPIEITWDPSRGDAVLQVYHQGTATPIYDVSHSSGVLMALEPGEVYEVKIWVEGPTDMIARWIKIRHPDPSPVRP